MIRVTHVQYLSDHRLYVRFSDGTEGPADFTPRIEKKRALAALKDISVFSRAFVDEGALCFPGEIDIATESVYALVHGLNHPRTLEDAEANEYAVSLRQLREHVQKTQAEMGGAIQMDQAQLSRFERLQDRKISTLRRYCDALGAELEIVAILDGKRFIIRGA
jgi:hypothetical protein